MNERTRRALVSDLVRLQENIIPDLIQGLGEGDELRCRQARALVTGGFGALFKISMDELTTYVLDEAKKGNKEPLRSVASGDAFNR